MHLIETVRQPEYTGANRCWPCTITNLAITVVLAVVFAVVFAPLAVVFVPLALVSIWLRGYLVPGTPELTKRYFPDWLLAVFDKGPASEPDGFAVEDATGVAEAEPIDIEEVSPEELLLDAGVVEPCTVEGMDDLCLTDAFRTDWDAALARVNEDGADRVALAEALDAEGEVAFVEHGEALSAYLDDEFVGQWESRPALVADLAAASVLPDWLDEWNRLGAAGQGTLARALRVFVEVCPDCGGPVVPAEKTVKSCCREYNVMAIACEDCGARLFETPA